MPKLLGVSDSMFEGCSSLAEFSTGQELAVVGSRAFEGCSSLSSVKWQQSASTLARIGSRAFYGCSSLSSISLPSSLTSIGEDAFKSTAPGLLTSIDGCIIAGWQDAGTGPWVMWIAGIDDHSSTSIYVYTLLVRGICDKAFYGE